MGDRTCSAEDCDRTNRLRLGLCGKHYQRHTKYGSAHLPPRIAPTCDGPGCSRPAGDSGLCRSHYKQAHLGKPLTPLRVATKDLGRPEVCTFPDCGRPHKARGLCKAHRDQVSKGQAPRPVKDYAPGAVCSRDGCEAEALARGLCAADVQHFYSITTRYGLTIEQYESMLAAQRGACAVCGGVNANGYRLSIDHDHACCPGNRSCGRCVRALLCSSCNFILGHAGDQAERLRRAADYLDQWNAREVMRAV